MRLERAGAADLPAVAALVNDAFRGAGATASWNSEAAYMDGERTSAADLAGEIAGNPDAVLLVTRSEDAGSLIGSVWLEPAETGIWYLGVLTIRPGLQNTGLGRRLLTAAETWAAERGARTIRMKVVNVRETLIAWYIRRGYRLTEEREPFPYDQERFGRAKRDDLLFVILERTL